MEIISSNDGLLTNIEVADLIELRRKQRKSVGQSPIVAELQDRERIETRVAKYVVQSAPGNTSELVSRCLSALKELQLDLTEAELIQVANHIPLFPVEIHLIVEECAERLSEELLTSVLEVMQATYSSLN
mmetsp:Transcript_7716/g.7810  ORF Transcript_7716/g.7810 Transcript_7716/m.7810 type:complete len:130 (-) Transcript_7716:142-531(-)|eukprot:CAMPEP_0119037190 /NCGR_PEP_ID=MMETSP1177-20130426/5392_1 /TAXON_ID=2985 /ORGANISM="Ochromonas sp, Strain CCMP1899" /LENGTH=129 /DNA_ID=CAMNT_0006998105 /DNA_START=249 /DNA_END=638 /DNA_ORIENTATION=-